ncbi:MAG: bifunctional 4-hydroxy-2-oxoglutarate aldolase/2-dehydro-3-deoxy-phosphogluconate aldolase [Candidatus Dormibacteria bacterium]
MLTPELAALFPTRLAAVVRWHDEAQAWSAARTAAEAGVGSVEITAGSAGAFGLVERLRAQDSGCVVGAGTVTSAAIARQAIAAGAQYLVSPHLVPAVAQVAGESGIPMVMGALTPTEIVQALELGARLVKVFPAAPVGGPGYIRALRGPMPQAPLWVSGGVLIEDAARYREAGADVIGLTADLFRPDLLAAEDWEGVAVLCRMALAAVGAIPAATAGANW